MRSRLPDECTEFRFQGTCRLLRPATAKRTSSNGHSELFNWIKRTTSDQKGTEEILERAGMALFRSHWLLHNDTADNEALVVVWQHWQNRDWGDGRRNGLDTGKERRS